MTREERDALILQYQGVVDYVLGKLRVFGDVREELRSVGMLALVQAAEKFDPDRGVKFLSYAIPAIRRELQKAGIFESWLKPKQLERLRDVRRVCAELEAAGEPLDTDVVAERLGLTAAKVRESLAIGRAVSFLRIDFHADDDSPTMDIPDRGSRRDRDLGERLIAEEREALVAAALTKLTPRQRVAVIRRYWLGASYRETADGCGVTHQAVHQAHDAALRRLRTAIDPEAA